MAGKTRELAWSLTKARMFDECPRRYYYAYYLSKAAHYPDAPEHCRLAGEMKRIQALDMWVGAAVHDTIQWALEEGRNGRVPSVDEAHKNVQQRLSDGWQASRKQLWRTGGRDEHPNLFEHYYKLPVGPAAIERVKDKAYTSVRNFMASDLLRSIVDTPAERWLPIEKYAAFRMDGLLVYVKFDFALRDGPRLAVYDWKTGKPTSHEIKQLTCYAMYACERWETPIENTKVCAAHLFPELHLAEHLVDPPMMDELRLHVKQSFKAMLSHLRDPARNIAAMEDFPMTDNLPRCLRCSFKGICEQAKIAEGQLHVEVPFPEDWEG